jgi:hypothetical protein
MEARINSGPGPLRMRIAVERGNPGNHHVFCKQLRGMKSERVEDWTVVCPGSWQSAGWKIATHVSFCKERRDYELKGHHEWPCCERKTFACHQKKHAQRVYHRLSEAAEYFDWLVLEDPNGDRKSHSKSNLFNSRIRKGVMLDCCPS